MNRIFEARLSQGLRHGLSAICVVASLGVSMLMTPPAVAQSNSAGLATATGTIQSGDTSSSGAPLQLRDSGNAVDKTGTSNNKSDPSTATATTSDLANGERRALDAPVYKPGEFERYVQSYVQRVLRSDEPVQPGQPSRSNEVRRLGIDLIEPLTARNDSTGHNPLVPADYLLQSGDEILLTIWGSADADLRLTVDRSGRISVPRVGSIMVSGVRYAELPDVISRRVAQVFKNFQLSVSLGQLRGIRVFVTGFVAKPGVLMVNSLSTLSQALLRAGGPAASGSFRNVMLRRGRDVVATFDLYDLLLNGDRSSDRLLQPDDVIHVGPIGPQVALIGSVSRPAIFELKPGETVNDLLRMAGGFSPVADTSQLALERITDRAGTRVALLPQPESGNQTLRNGDVLRAYNIAELTLSTLPQKKRVRIEGEVGKPGEYVLPPDSTIGDALAAAGGLTSNAYLFGTEFNRVSVRATQQQNYERALRDFETELVRAPVAERAGNADEAAARTSIAASGARLLEKLRDIKPTGRLVLQLEPRATSLPEMALEDGDRLYIPARPNTVGVFGSVFSAGSYLHTGGRTVGEYLRLAGGPTRRADASSVFVVRANGTVTSSLAESGFFSRGNQIAGLATEPGDTIFVPDEINRTTWVQGAKDWTQILYQFGLGIAGLKSALN